MSTRVEQALREYQDAVARSVASQGTQQDSEPQEPREKSKSAYQASRGAYLSKLSRRGLVEKDALMGYTSTWRMTQQGRTVLENL